MLIGIDMGTGSSKGVATTISGEILARRLASPPTRTRHLLWRPHRRIYLVNAAGTHPLGDTEYAQALWRAATGLINGIPMN